MSEVSAFHFLYQDRRIPSIFSAKGGGISLHAPLFAWMATFYSPILSSHVEREIGLYSTCASPVVPHLSTRHAHGCLASEIGRDPAFPTRYDRTESSSRVTSPDMRVCGHSALEQRERESLYVFCSGHHAHSFCVCRVRCSSRIWGE